MKGNFKVDSAVAEMYDRLGDWEEGLITREALDNFLIEKSALVFSILFSERMEDNDR